jgi:predicted CoA-binding protein
MEVAMNAREQSDRKPRGTKAQIDEFLGCRRIAMVGLSRAAKSYSRVVARGLRREHELTGVNRNTNEIDGVACVSEIAMLPKGVDGVFIALPPGLGDAAVRECLSAGIRRIWVRGLEHKGSVSGELAAQCEQSGVALIDGRCPLMFLNSGFPHNLHGRIAKWFGMWPK